MLRGITFSDLHLLAGRQKEHHWEPWMCGWRSNYDLCILNGDIFDFRWSRERERVRSIRIAEAWLRHLLEPRERASFVILLGNHDSCPQYQRLLMQLSDEYAHLHWEEHWWVLGDKIFLHGDIPDLSGALEPLQAYRAHHHGLSMRSPHPLRHWFYQSATRVGITGSVPRVLPWKKQCLRTDVFLKQQLGTRYETIRDVFLGHTHVHFSDYQHQGTLFHNCGAPFRGARFRPAEFRFSQSDWQRSVENPLGIDD